MITPEARQEFKFWVVCLVDYNCQSIWHSDASDTGYGGYVVEHGACVSYGQWTECEAQLLELHMERAHSSFRVITAISAKLLNFRVRWFTDNQNVTRILLVGSKKPLVQAVALKVFFPSLYTISDQA